MSENSEAIKNLLERMKAAGVGQDFFPDNFNSSAQGPTERSSRRTSFSSSSVTSAQAELLAHDEDIEVPHLEHLERAVSTGSSHARTPELLRSLSNYSQPIRTDSQGRIVVDQQSSSPSGWSSISGSNGHSLQASQTLADESKGGDLRHPTSLQFSPNVAEDDEKHVAEDDEENASVASDLEPHPWLTPEAPSSEQVAQSQAAASPVSKLSSPASILRFVNIFAWSPPSSTKSLSGQDPAHKDSPTTPRNT